MSSILLALVLCASAGAELPVYGFDSEEALKQWVPNGYIADVQVQDGVLHGRPTDWDPFFSNRTMDFAATPWQCVRIRIKATKSGMLELFWSGTLEGELAGLNSEKRATTILKGGDWEEVVLFPFWQGEGRIKQMRLDLYDGASFEIDKIEVVDWSNGREPETANASWTPSTGAAPWTVYPNGLIMAPAMRLDIEDKAWITIEASAAKETSARILWACDEKFGFHELGLTLRGDGKSHVYNVEVSGDPFWRTPVVGLGMRLPGDAGIKVDSVSINAEPAGPSELRTTQFIFENAPNRVGKPCRILARVTNLGGKPAGFREASLSVPSGVKIIAAPDPAAGQAIGFADYLDLIWEVQADTPGAYDIKVSFDGKGVPDPVTATFEFTTPPVATPTGYVPEPKPIKTSIDILAYYFPGWDSAGKWDCIRRVAPVRKPILGYYDESKPECVDWQIKWAVENGISCFLVDWYWVQSSQMLTHWFDAYRVAKYRDMLKVAIMWANHNPPKTHSLEDWKNVTREWIDKYFNLPTYYRQDGKPVVFFWYPEGLESDMGGIEGVQQCLQASQQMAKDAGLPGIVFIAMNGDPGGGRAERLLKQGYEGFTTYHEWGSPDGLAFNQKRLDFKDVVRTVPATWRAKDDASGALTYYTVADTGWDSRPWHGDSQLVISGRNVALWTQLLQDAKVFLAERGKKALVLGPLNEWGEGSYIEPATEYGFGMYEALRSVFGDGDPASWPVNIAPSDVGLGPYDFPPPPILDAWDFENGLSGWSNSMGLTGFGVKDGALVCRSTSSDPALNVFCSALHADDYKAVTIRMKLTAVTKVENTAQVFWGTGGSPVTESASATFPVQVDGEYHTYTVELEGKPRWRARISSFRFDPIGLGDVDIAIDDFRLVRK